ncbi:serine/threonine-protein kinase [Nocardia sp. NPDC127526]|uniref:serine/threonine-protein kinase n=1 Tax=Nocardia sp. NPDC127526 TaxID=3345393 RepID=UPI00362B27BD
MPENPRPGAIFAGYRIERALGSGGMGTVYVARHPRLPRSDALKILSVAHADHPEYREYHARFLREADMAGRLNHPNIVAVHDRGVEHGRPWIAMQYIAGTDAGELTRGGAGLAPEHAVHIVEQAARGLDEAHRRGMVHRDVKPANILIAPSAGQPDRVLVTDFGIGWAAGETTQLTQEGTVLATIAYAAPEQLSGHRVDHRADIYALGCTLYELLTGAKPFPRPTPAAVMHAHLADPPPRATAMRPELPAGLDGVLARAMAKDPSHRYPSCGALAAAARAALGGVMIPAPDARATGRGRRRVLAVGALVAAGALAAAAVALLRNPGGDQGGTTAGPASATTASTSLTTSAPATGVGDWGSHEYMTDAFPGLLPVSPDAAGPGGIRCVALDPERVPVNLDLPASGVTKIHCNGDKNPVELMVVRCNADRSKNEPVTLESGMTIVGQDSWERSTGSGRMVWGDVAHPRRAGQAGVLVVSFDDAGRSFCQVMAYGGNSGQELLERWWPTAPL